MYRRETLELALMAPSSSTRDEVDRWLTGQRPKLVRSAQSILGDRQEAEDVVQQTMLAVWQRAQREAIRNPGGYLARAVYWNAVKRRARRRTEISLEPLPLANDNTSPPYRDNELDPVELEVAISQLPTTQQTVIRLRFYLGLTFREIGNNLSISTNTAASRARYALTNLRRLLGVSLTANDKETRNE